MKTIFQLLIYNLICFVAVAQFNVTIKTPKGTNVAALDYLYLYEDYNQTEWESEDNYWLTYGNVDSSEVTLLAHSSIGYNCHSYAWHVSEGGDTLWINDLDANYNDIDNVNKYWDDDSYLETTQSNHCKVFYHPETQNDHSAVTTSQSGWFISKWANGPLVRHKYDNCPFWNSSVNLKYYKLSNPTISGSTSPLCNNVQRTFSESAFTDIDLDYDWSAPSPLSEVSGDGTSSYTVKGTSQNGLGTVSLMVTTPSGAMALQVKTVWVGAPVISSIDGPQGTPNNHWAYYSAQLESSLSAPTEYNWTLSPLNGNYVYEHGANGINVNCDILFSNTGNYQLVVQAKNTCSAPNFGPYCVRGIYVYNSYYMMISPNPTTGETTISIESKTEELGLKSASTESVFDETTEWDMEIYSPAQALKEKKTKLKGNSTTIQTQSWKEGVYVVRVKYKDEILTGKLVVKK